MGRDYTGNRRAVALFRRLIVGPLRSHLRPFLLLGFDSVVAMLSLTAALSLRFDGAIPEEHASSLVWLLILLGASRVVAGRLSRIHRWSFRLCGLPDAARVAASGLFGTALFALGVYMLQLHAPPRSTVVMELLLTTSVMGLVRFSPRLGSMYLIEHRRSQQDDVFKTVIVGAELPGEVVLRNMRRSPEHPFNVVGFVDAGTAERGLVISGKPVLGGIGDLPTIIERFGIKAVLVAAPDLSAKRLRHLLELCSDHRLTFKVASASVLRDGEFPQNGDRQATLRNLEPEDLLQREVVDLKSTELQAAISKRRVMVTGAAGFIGSELARQLLDSSVSSLVMLDKDENGLYMLSRRLQRQFPDANIAVEVADVRDAGRVEEILRRHGPQDVFHAAAHKHVPLMEFAPCEAVKNNVVGTRVVAELVQECGAERFTYISTDKAVRPSSVMGATKRAGEMLVQEYQRRGSTSYQCVRFGNVLGSTGSVVEVFQEQIREGGPLTVHHADARRYFLLCSEAVGLVLQATYGDYGDICVLNMGEEFYITELARLMITMDGKVPGQDIEIVFSELSPGEKLQEELFTREEMEHATERNSIMTVPASAPPIGLVNKIDELSEAASFGDEGRVLEMLREIVSDYRPAAVHA